MFKMGIPYRRGGKGEEILVGGKKLVVLRLDKTSGSWSCNQKGRVSHVRLWHPLPTEKQKE